MIGLVPLYVCEETYATEEALFEGLCTALSSNDRWARKVRRYCGGKLTCSIICNPPEDKEDPELARCISEILLFDPTAFGQPTNKVCNPELPGLCEQCMQGWRLIHLLKGLREQGICPA